MRTTAHPKVRSSYLFLIKSRIFRSSRSKISENDKLPLQPSPTFFPSNSHLHSFHFIISFSSLCSTTSFLSVSNLGRSIAFYERALAPLGIKHVHDFDGSLGPPGHPDLKGFGKDGQLSFWLKEGFVKGGTTHVGFVADSKEQVEETYNAAMEAGAKDNGRPEARMYYDPRYYAGNVLDPDGHSLEFVYKSWQH